MPKIPRHYVGGFFLQIELLPSPVYRMAAIYIAAIFGDLYFQLGELSASRISRNKTAIVNIEKRCEPTGLNGFQKPPFSPGLVQGFWPNPKLTYL